MKINTTTTIIQSAYSMWANSAVGTATYWLNPTFTNVVSMIAQNTDSRRLQPPRPQPARPHMSLYARARFSCGGNQRTVRELSSGQLHRTHGARGVPWASRPLGLTAAS